MFNYLKFNVFIKPLNLLLVQVSIRINSQHSFPVGRSPDCVFLLIQSNKGPWAAQTFLDRDGAIDHNLQWTDVR